MAEQDELFLDEADLDELLSGALLQDNEGPVRGVDYDVPDADLPSISFERITEEPVTPHRVGYGDRDIFEAAGKWKSAVRESIQRQYPRGISEEKARTELRDREDTLFQYGGKVPTARPTVSQIKSAFEKYPALKEASKIDSKMVDIIEAIERGDEGFAEELIKKAPANSFMDELSEPTGTFALLGRASRSRLIPIKPGGEKDPRKVAHGIWKKTAARIQKETNNGEVSLWEQIQNAWAGSTRMTKEEAKSTGLLRDEEPKESFWRPVELFEGGPMVAKGLSDFVARTAIVSGAAEAVAPVFLEGEDLERFKKEIRAANPSEIMEQTALVVRNARDRGESEETIRKELREELNRSLLQYAYKDLPENAKFDEPDLDLATKFVKSNRSIAMRRELGQVSRFASMVLEGDEDKEDLQQMLNSVPLKQLPENVWEKTIPSVNEVVDKTIDGIDYIIGAQDASGLPTTLEMERDIGEAMIKEVDINGKIYLVEGNIARWLSLIGGLTETVAEARLPLGGVIPITPADRDFYYNFGKRDPSSTWWTRVLANIETREMGFTRHLTDEALFRGKDRGDLEYHAAAILGLGADLLVPWEKGQFRIAAAPVRTAYAGVKTMRATKGLGYSANAFYAGAFPKLFQMHRGVSKRVTMASERLGKRFEGTPTAQDLRRSLDETGESALSYEEAWLADQALVLMERKKSPLSYDDAIKRLKVVREAEVWENVAHITETFIRRKMKEPNEGVDLYENLPPKLKGTIRRVLDQVTDYRDVEMQLGLHFSERGKLQRDLLDIMYKYGDPETAAIRLTEEYREVAREVSKMVDDGIIDASDYPVVMGYLESQAIRSAIDTASELSDFKAPTDYFRNTVIRRLESPTADGSTWRIEVRAPEGQGVGKNIIDSLSLTSKQVERLSEFFRSGDVESLFTALESAEPSNPLRLIMGDSWLNTLYRQFDHTVEKIGEAKRAVLTERGKAQLRASLNTFFFDQGGGSSQVGGVWRFYRDFQARFGNYWVRIAAERDAIGTQINGLGKLNRMFDPAVIYADDLVGVSEAGRDYAMPRKVVVTHGEAGLRQGRVPAYGRRREYWDVDFNRSTVRFALGITDDMDEIAADELFSRAVGFVVGEHFHRQLKGIKFDHPTARTIVREGKAESISKAVQAKIAKTLGAPQKTLFDAETGDYKLNPTQQARMRVLLRQIENEPLAKIIPARLFEVGSDLRVIKHGEFLSIIDALTDIEAGVFSRVTDYKLAIPESLGKSLWNVLSRAGDRAGDTNKHIAGFTANLKKAFVVSDELYNSMGPAQREVVRRHIQRIEKAPREVMQWAIAAMKGDKQMSMDALMDHLRSKLIPPVAREDVDAIVGSTITRPRELGPDGKFLDPVDSQDGFVDLLSEFTDAEKVRYKLFKEAEKKADGGEMQRPREPDLFRGEGGVAADSHAFSVSQAGSKMEYILKDTTLAEMKRILRGSGRLTTELEEAFAYLLTHKNTSGVDLTHPQRMAMGKALEVIRDSMIWRKQQIVARGREILVALAGGGSSILTNLHPRVAARAYKLFYKGGDGWIELLEFLQNERALEIGLETIGGTHSGVFGLPFIQGRARVPRYRLTEAFLGAIVRMRAMEILHDMADDMVRYGMPGDIQKFSKPKPIVNTFGKVVAAPIEEESYFWKRVKFYIEQELSFSMTRIEERAYKRDAAGKVEIDEAGDPVVSDKRIIEPQAPGRELWADEGPDYRAVKGGTMGNPHDFVAYSRAQEIIASYGKKYRPEGFEEYTFPSGQVGLVPKQLITEIDNAFDRAAKIGTARIGSLPEIGTNRIGSPVTIDQQTGRLVAMERGVGRVIEFILDKNPLTIQNTKMGVTTGLFLPNPAYFFGVGMGGALQLYQGVGPVAATKMLFKNNGMVSAVMARLWKDGLYAPGNPVLVSKNGMSYTADQVASLAQQYGLKSSFILAEAPQSLAQSMNKLRAKGINKVYWSAAEWQRTLIESATAMDNYYRLSVFTDALSKGKSPAEAAKLARKVAFDYADLTDVEKSVFRNVFMFYSYLRKNMDLFWDTILTNPERVIGQIRAMKGVHNAYIAEDTEVRLFERDYAKTRFAVGFKNAAAKNHTTDQWMYLTPPIPAYDAAGFMGELISAIQGDEEAQRYMVTQINPWVQAPFVLASQKDIFFNKDLNQYNPVPPFLVHMDRTLLGNTLTNGFRIKEAPQLDLSRRYVEGDEYAGHYVAEHGRWWWVWKNLLQTPFAGRSMDTLAYLDRANLGPMEAWAKISRMIHEEGVERGAWEYNPLLSMVEKDTFGPRSGLTELDERLGLFGIKPFPVPTSKAAHQKIIAKWVEQIGREIQEADLTDEGRIINRRITPRK